MNWAVHRSSDVLGQKHDASGSFVLDPESGRVDVGFALKCRSVYANVNIPGCQPNTNGQRLLFVMKIPF